ncbi:MAG: TetR/AcrR family transcriptional regulator [Anaerotignum propionicum]|uniref:TetR/AcrR family transcriptional regulator n=1 Tax=Anaerotignum propionicum TaxID=28446 RepID=UPI002B21C171|nr:TetR/AcrR family transcriptional regulator [Anaerotignum propionicum]MEA5057965.1 TetR/AcrR family transcriptional regulator [Anaerotignum propionicum]
MLLLQKNFLTGHALTDMIITFFENVMGGGFILGRNKYPEETVEKILEVSLKLFLEKGYDNVIIRDIANELGGLTKGAVYHHFKSKEEILSALNKSIFEKNNPFIQARKDTELNGLQKIKKVLKLSLLDADKQAMDIASLPLIKNPRFLANVLDNQINVVAPLLAEMIEEGIEDGSIQTECPKQLSELFVLMTNLWLTPTVFPTGKDEIMDKIVLVKKVFDNLGLPVFDEEITLLCNEVANEFKNNTV